MTKLLYLRFEINCFTPEKDTWICRIGMHSVQPQEVNDGFYPNEDLGFLWFRYVGSHFVCSGLLCSAHFTKEQGDLLLAFIDEHLIKSDQQIDYQIVFFNRVSTVVESGEESTQF